MDATLPPGSYRFSAEPIETARAATLQIRSTLEGVRGALDGRPMPVSLTTVQECLEEIEEQASYVSVRSGLNEATECDLAAGDAMVIPWASDVAATANVALAGDASVSLGDASRPCASNGPQLFRIEFDRGGSELRIGAIGPVRVTGIELVPKRDFESREQ